LLTKRTHILSILLICLAFPAAALAATGGDDASLPSAAVGPEAAVAPAEVAPLAILRRPVTEFHQLVHTLSKQIRAEHLAALRKQREEMFADLPGGVSIETLESIAACESGGDPAAVSSDGSYRGKYQFDFGTWESVGGSGDPAAAPEDEQDYRAALLYSRSGSSPWPVCG
jgi:transglycosylase-like protein